MADTLKLLGKGTLTTSEATLYTVPASTTTIVKSIILWLCNKTDTDATVNLKFAGTEIYVEHKVALKDTLCIQLTSVLEATATIIGKASAADTINYYISGIDVTYYNC